MTHTRKKQVKRLQLERRHHRGSDDEGTTQEVQAWYSTPLEQRSKQRNETWRVETRALEKGKKLVRSPPSKKRRKELVRQESDEEEDEARTESDSLDKENRNEEEISDEEKYFEPTPQPRPQRIVKKGQRRKQLVMVDARGEPYGKETAYLAEDVKAFAKGLDPCYGWSDQPLHKKQRFFNCVYAEWEVGGEQTEINPSWYPKFITKQLINRRHNLCKMIDAGDAKPPEVDPEVWHVLSTRRKTQKAQEKSDKMRSISLARGSKEAQMRAIEKKVIGELTLQLKRIPFESEVKDATEAEFKKRQCQAQKLPPDYGQELEEIRAMNSELGGRLSHLEDMMQQLINSIGQKGLHVVSAEGSKAATTHALIEDNVKGDAGENTEQTLNPVEDAIEDVVEGVIEDTDADVDYLVDNVSDGLPLENNGGSKAIKDVQKDIPQDIRMDASHAVHDKPIQNFLEDAVIPTSEDGSTDVMKDSIQSGAEDRDPYSILAKEVPIEQEVMMAVDVDKQTAHEVVNLPSAMVASRPNRGTRILPTEFVKTTAPTTRSAKAEASKALKPNPPKAVNQPKKGASVQKK